MTKFLLSLHVLAAIVAIGPVTVAASMFPAAARRGDRDQLPLLHRICRVYALFGVAVPVFGLATASSLGVLTDPWLIVSIVLTAAAAALLGLVILPSQQRIITGEEGSQHPTVVGEESGQDPTVVGEESGQDPTVVGEESGQDPTVVGEESGQQRIVAGVAREVAGARQPGGAGEAGGTHGAGEMGEADDSSGVRSADGMVGAGREGGLIGGQGSVARGEDRRLGMLTGVFNLLWAAVVILMIVRPGSTTGA